MKKKIHKILGVGLTLVLVLTFAIGISAPVAASPGTDEWETFALPEAGEDGDYFMLGDDTITAVGPIARDIDGTLYAGVSSVTTAAVAAVAEQSTITLSGSPRVGSGVGDVITVTVAGDSTPTTYTVVAADIGATDAASLAAIAIKVAAAINADAQASVVVTATSTGAVVTLTADVAGLAGAFSLTSSVTTSLGASTLAATVTNNTVAAADLVAATLSVGTTNTLDLTADVPGTVGNSITYAAVDPGAASIALTVSVSGTAITVTLATDAGSLITSTNANVAALLSANVNSAFLVDAAVTGVGTTVATVIAATPLAGGTNLTAEQSIITLSGSPTVGPGVGDVITVTVAVDSTPTTYTVVPADIGATDAASWAAIALKVADAINADTTGTTTTPAGTAGAAGVVTASASGAVVTLTADVEGTAGAFSLTSSVTTPKVTAGTLVATVDDDTVPAAAGTGAVGAANDIFKSLDDEGRRWEKTDYSTDAADDVVAIVCSTVVDADEVYVASSTTLWRTRDGGDSWVEVGDDALLGGAAINCLAVGWDDDDDARVFVGANNGEVYYLYDVAFGTNWTALNLDVAGGAATDVLSIAVSPNFVEDSFQAVLAVDANETFVAWHVGSNPGGWDDIEIENDASANFVATGGALAFPADFDADDFEDGNQEIFVGIIGALHAGGDGGVVRIYDTSVGDYDILDDVDADIASLAIVGNLGDTQMLAGEAANADVWYSWDDGDNWEQASDEGIQPAGAGPTYVLMDENFDGDTGIGWAATAPAEGGMHMTIDGGTSWQGVGLLDTDITRLDAVAVVSSDKMYLVTWDGGAMEVFRFASDWERIYEQARYGLGTMDTIGVYGDTIVLADAGTKNMAYSDDGGQIFAEPTKEPGDNIGCLLVIDEDTWWVGDDNGDLWVTDRAGARTWDDYDITNDAITSLAVRGEEAIAGTDDSEVWYSEDEGETWDQVGDQIDATGVGDTFVCFADDNDEVIYAATDNTLARFQYLTIDLEEDWEDFTNTLDTATGIVVSADGTVYVSDSDAGDGVQRSVNPLEDLDDVTATEFEKVTTELDSGATLDSLQLTAGSNVLWANDKSTATLWTYEDTLAVQVELIGPPNGETTARTDRATLSWQKLDAADSYIIQWDASADFDYSPWLWSVKTTSCSITDGIEAGQTFYWRVRVGDLDDDDQIGNPVFSKWSDVWSFTLGIAGGEWNPFLTRDMYPGNVAPEPGAGDVPIRPTFQWNAADWATSYEFQLADNPEFTGAIIKTLTTTAYAHDADLDYSATYYWRVRAMSATSESEWGSGIFTTMATPVVEFCCPECGLCFDTEAELQAHWDAVHAVAPTTPAYIWVIIAVGALLVIAMLILIVRTRRTV